MVQGGGSIGLPLETILAAFCSEFPPYEEEGNRSRSEGDRQARIAPFLVMRIARKCALKGDHHAEHSNASHTSPGDLLRLGCSHPCPRHLYRTQRAYCVPGA